DRSYFRQVHQSRGAPWNLAPAGKFLEDEIRSAGTGARLSDLAAQLRQFTTHLTVRFRLIEPAEDMTGDCAGFAVVGQVLGEQFLVRQEVDQANEAAGLEEPAHKQIEPANAINHH